MKFRMPACGSVASWRKRASGRRSTSRPARRRGGRARGRRRQAAQRRRRSSRSRGSGSRRSRAGRCRRRRRASADDRFACSRAAGRGGRPTGGVAAPARRLPARRRRSPRQPTARASWAPIRPSLGAGSSELLGLVDVVADGAASAADRRTARSCRHPTRACPARTSTASRRRRTPGGDAERERARGDLLTLPVGRHEDVGRGEQVGDLVDR